MARKPDARAAAKVRKQKIILIVGSVALLGLGAIQGPKLLKHGGSAATEAAPTTVADTSPNVPVAAGARAGTATAGTSSGTVAVASLAGVQIRSAGALVVDNGQLWSFSTFDAKDPFVPQGAAKPPAEANSTPAANPPSDPAVTEPAPPTTPVETTPVETTPVETTPVETTPVETTPVETTPVETTPVETTPVETTPVETTPVETTPVETTPVETTPVKTTPVKTTPVEPPPVQEPPAEAPVTVPVVPPKPAFATIEVNGAAQYLAPGDTFPKLSQVFVLVGLKREAVKIGVAGGSFSGGKTAGLKLGKSLTAVDRATGVRYVLKLVYLGPEPEVVEAFSSGSEKQPTASGK